MPVDILEMDKIDAAKAHLQQFILWPAMWHSFNLDLSKFKWEQVRFQSKFKSKVPAKNGVYSFVIQPQIANHPHCSYLMYIGQTTDQDLRKRFEQYIQEQKGKRNSRAKVGMFLKKYKDHLFYVFLPLDNKLAPKDVESELLKAFLPPINDADALPVEVRKTIKAAGF